MVANSPPLSLHYRARRWGRAAASAIAATGLVLSAPQPSHAGLFDNVLRGLLNGGVQAIQLSTLSDEQEVQFGAQINEQITQEVRLYRNRRVVGYVDGIGQRLAAASPRPDIPYTFQVVDDPSINAFATMGGYVYVNTGLLRAAKNEAELASVIAHEIGHIAEEHALEQMKESAIASGVATVAGVDRDQFVQLGVELALRRPNSRRDEYEADEIGLQTLARAGYDPRAAVSFMRTLQQASGGSPPTILSTHPATGERAERLAAAIPEGARGRGLDEEAYRQAIAPVLAAR